MSSTRDDTISTKEVVPRRPKSLWLNRDYMLLWSGQVVSNVGTQVSTLAFPLLILAVTGSPAQAGFVGALRALPYVIFSLPAGALLDRWDRKRTMILCDTGHTLRFLQYRRGCLPTACGTAGAVARSYCPEYGHRWRYNIDLPASWCCALYGGWGRSPSIWCR